eukprot:207099-Hanusia_phi.AAC.12
MSKEEKRIDFYPAPSYTASPFRGLQRLLWLSIILDTLERSQGVNCHHSRQDRFRKCAQGMAYINEERTRRARAGCQKKRDR